jgi:hypothetical protein
MVAAFGSRPSGVSAIERVANPSILVAETRDGVVVDSRPQIPVPPSIGVLVRASTVARAPGASSSGSASPAECAFDFSGSLSAATACSARVVRRTPCAACGDGSPYDATAPPHSDVIARG